MVRPVEKGHCQQHCHEEDTDGEGKVWQALDVCVVRHPVDPDKAPETEGKGQTECSAQKAGYKLGLKRVWRVREKPPNRRKKKAKQEQPYWEPGGWAQEEHGDSNNDQDEAGDWRQDEEKQERTGEQVTGKNHTFLLMSSLAGNQS